jgi:hypothetical protein
MGRPGASEIPLSNLLENARCKPSNAFARARTRGMWVNHARRTFMISSGTHGQDMMLAVIGCSPRSFARFAYTFLSKPKARSCRTHVSPLRKTRRDVRRLQMMKYWEIIADNLKKRGWSLGYVSAVDSEGRTIWIADAHRGAESGSLCGRMKYRLRFWNWKESRIITLPQCRRVRNRTLALSFRLCRTRRRKRRHTRWTYQVYQPKVVYSQYWVEWSFLVIGVLIPILAAIMWRTGSKFREEPRIISYREPVSKKRLASRSSRVHGVLGLTLPDMI